MNSETRASYSGLRNDIADHVPETALDILDLGCSDGTLGRELLRRVPGRTIDGVEGDQEFATMAGRTLRRVIAADLNDDDWSHSLRKGSYDCVICADILEHLLEPSRVLSIARELLKSDGYLILSVPNIRHVSAFFTIFVRGRFPRSPRGLFDATHLRWFTFKEVSTLCRDCGFLARVVTSNVRITDRPGGKINDFSARLFSSVRGNLLVREFLGYQLIIVAQRDL